MQANEDIEKIEAAAREQGRQEERKRIIGILSDMADDDDYMFQREVIELAMDRIGGV